MMRVYPLLFLSLLFSSCLSKEEDVVNVGLLNGPSSIVMAAAMEEATYFEGQHIHYLIKDSPQHLRALIQSGNLDMAIVPMTMAYNMIENNFNIKIAAITGWGNLFILGQDSIGSFQELEGKTISVPGEGQTPDLVSRFLVDYFSMQDKISLNYTYPSPLLLTSALAVGKIQYAILPEPLASLAKQKNPQLKRCLNLAELWQHSLPDIALVQSVLIVKTDYYTAHSAWFEAYLNASQDLALKHIQQTSEALQLAIKHELLAPGIQDTLIITRSRLDFKRDSSIADDINSYLQTFYSLQDDFNIYDHLILEKKTE